MGRFLITILALLPFTLYGQRVPDNAEIRNAVSNPASPYHYPPLMMRYQRGDTTLTTDDYYYLYYGYAFQSEYDPWQTVMAEDKLLTAFDKDPVVSPETAAKMVEYGSEVMKADPFSPRNINFMAYAYVTLGDTLNAKICSDRFNKILKTIESSGTGLREKSPWHVLWFSHMDDLLASRGLQPKRRMVRSLSVEYVELLNRDGDRKGYFFDFSRVYWRKPDVREEDGPKGFEINGIEVGRKRTRPVVH